MLFYKRFFSTQPNKWQQSIKQVTKSNFNEELTYLKTHLSDSDFVAVSLQKTGGFSALWQKVLPFDTAEIAYLKAKRSAENFQILQFAVCPFSFKASNLIAHPYNFHLFPRDELNLNMPCYTFSCQSSFLSSMAHKGFDFNACIHDGISYLSREQELSDKVQVGYLGSFVKQSFETNSVADSVFRRSIRSRVSQWIDSCRGATVSNKTENVFISSLRTLVSGSGQYGSRPCLTIDVSSGKQAQLVLEVIKEYVYVVPIRVPARAGGVQVVRVVLTSSEEDRSAFLMELRKAEGEKNKQVRGFREVIELISTSGKPVIAHNALQEFAFIHSKFLSSLPLTMEEFRSSLHLVFPQILDVNHLVQDIGPYKIDSVTSTSAYLKRRFFAPVDLDISNRGETDKANMQRHVVLEICHLFVNLCSILELTSEKDHIRFSPSLQCRSNMFNPCSNIYGDSKGEDVGISTGNNRSVSTESLVFLWGLRDGISVGKIKGLLHDCHAVSSESFYIHLVDKSCAVVVFWTPGIAESFRTMMDSGTYTSNKLKDEISKGLKATGYETYKRVCELGLWESDLAECLDKVLENTGILSEALLQQEQSVICWNTDDIINLDEL